MYLLIYARPAPQCPVRINLLVGHVFNTADPDADYLTILVGENKVMLKFESREIQESALSAMDSIYHLSMSREDIEKFGKVDIIGTPIFKLKKYIANYYNFKEYYEQPGILTDSVSNELYNWIREARRSNVKLYNAHLRLQIEADGETPYPVIKNVIKNMTKQSVKIFSILYTYSKES
jgi:hypothetical protein